jgi:23S rRNA (guanosine2251-2'-O)-methyltransferase
MTSQQIVLIAHNLRSAHNVGSLLRMCDGLGIDTVWITGYTPHPEAENDKRLPHEVRKIAKQISKTALVAEVSQNWHYEEDVSAVISRLKQTGFKVAALEQTSESLPLNKFSSKNNIALIVGREVEGIETDILNVCDFALEIPMLGKKESFNVSNAAAMALYHLKFVK